VNSSETPAPPTPSPTKPERGKRMLPQMTPQDMMDYEPDPEQINVILGRPAGREAKSNGRVPFQRRS